MRLRMSPISVGLRPPSPGCPMGEKTGSGCPSRGGQQPQRVGENVPMGESTSPGCPSTGGHQLRMSPQGTAVTQPISLSGAVSSCLWFVFWSGVCFFSGAAKAVFPGRFRDTPWSSPVLRASWIIPAGPCLDTPGFPLPVDDPG